jgi:hypothetical protein
MNVEFTSLSDAHLLTGSEKFSCGQPAPTEEITTDIDFKKFFTAY